MQYINVGLVDALERALSWVDSDGAGLEDTSDLDTVTSLAKIHQIVICAHSDGVRCLAGWYRVGSFLKLDDLLVHES